MSTMKTSTQPYPGLRPFERWETDIFFGRETQTDELIERLKQHHFLAVLGPSGCGKSSLVRTGLMASLESGLLAKAGSHWQMAEMRPGNDPFGRLASGLLIAGGFNPKYSQPPKDPEPYADLTEATAFIEAGLRRSPMGLQKTLRQCGIPENTRLLLVVDQFEELFRYQQAGGNDATQFVALLLASALHEDIYVVLSMRTDFLGNCTHYRGLPEAINQGLYLTPRLERDQLKEAIGYPAAVFGGEVEPALVNCLVNAAGRDFDQLPLLQHTLMRLWQQAEKENPEKCQLTLVSYNELGGLQQALSDHADKIYADLSPEQQKIAEQLFRSLTEREAEGRDIRRPVILAEVAKLAAVSDQTVVEVVEKFRAPGCHFLTPAASTEPELQADSMLDISHESLIRQWDRLQEWVQQEAEMAEEYLRLEAQAQRYKAGKEGLLRSPALENGLAWQTKFRPTLVWAARYGGELELVEQYLAASEEEKKRITENKARKLRERTLSLFDSQLTHASLLAKVNDYAAAHEVLRDSTLLDATIPPDRQHARNLLAGYGEIMGSTAEKIYTGAGAGLTGGVVVSPDGHWLAAAGERGTLVLFNAETGELVQRFQGHDPQASSNGTVRSIVFDPKGKWLISGGDDQRIIRWSVPNGQQLDSWQAPAEVFALAINPEGNLLASGGPDKKITLWNSSSGKKLKTLAGHTDTIAHPNGLTFSSDSKYLASGSYDHTARVWDPTNGKTLRQLQYHSNRVQAVAFSPDNQFLATGSNDKQIVLWNFASGQPIRLLQGHDNIVFDVVFSRDGQGRIYELGELAYCIKKSSSKLPFTHDNLSSRRLLNPDSLHRIPTPLNRC